jgi:hypothetical protein
VHIRDQRLTVQLADATATVTVAFIVVLIDNDMKVGGGFLETVSLTGPLSSVAVPKTGSLPVASATKIPGGWELPRTHVFRVPRHPVGPLTTVRFNGHVEIWPAVKLHDQQVTNEGVLPARFPVMSAIADVVRAVTRRLRYLIVGR